MSADKNFRAAYFQAIARFAEVGVLVLDGAHKLSFVSEEALRVFDCDSSTVFEDVWLDEFSDLVERELRAAAEDSEEVRIPLEVKRDARQWDVLLRFVRLDEDDCHGYVGIVVRKVTLTATENAVFLASKMRVFSRMHQAMAHDLRTPLNAMTMAVELLRGDLSRDTGAGERERRDASKSLERLDLLMAELRRLDRMLMALLGETEVPTAPVREKFDLHAQVTQLRALVEAQAAAQGVTCSLEAASSGEILVEGYPDRIKQALWNLAVNGLEAMPDGGELIFRLDETAHEVQLTVEDTGNGVPESDRSSIWRVYHTTKPGGTGLGLYVVRSVVRAHGGTVRVLTGQRGGACFELKLPRSTGAERRSGAPPAGS